MLINRCSIICVVFASLLNGCGQAKAEIGQRVTNHQYQATITYTKHGVPHIKADDFSSLGFGVGYAQSLENLCTLADQIIKVKSQRAKYFGAGENNINLLSDVGYQGLNYIERAEVLYPTLGEKSRDMLEGYAAGYNKILLDLVSPDKYPSQCRGTNWVKKITAQELLAYQLDIAALSSSRNFVSAMAGSQPPQSQSAQNTLATHAASLLNMQRAVMTPSKGVGSNGWALGKDKVTNASAALLANPHFPWDGDLRFFQQQLTIPGEINVMGGTFIGFPAVLIGFNEHLGWTHTVSQSKRFTLYQLELDPNNPLRYKFDDQYKDMIVKNISVEVKQTDGNIKAVPWKLYFSHFGPIVNLSSLSPALGWTNTSAIALKDTNRDNVRGLDQWLAMNLAENKDDFFDAFEQHQAVPWVNTLLVTNEGTASYIDGTQVPQLSAQAEQYWAVASQSPELSAVWNDGAGSVLLPGNNTAFEWVDTGDAGSSGLVPFSKAPKQTRTDYEYNANDSYWLSNLLAPMDNYSLMYGTTQSTRSPRTRYNASLISNPNKFGITTNDNRFSFSALKEVFTQNSSLFSNGLRRELVERCAQNDNINLDGNIIDLTPACTALQQWDGQYQLNSQGAQVMREFLAEFRVVSPKQLSDELFAHVFDPLKPITTPSGLAVFEGSHIDSDPILHALAVAVNRLEQAGIEPDAPLSSIQYVLKQKGLEPIPVSGGYSFEGMFNIAEAQDKFGRNNTLLSRFQIGEKSGVSPLLSLDEDGGGATERYRVNYGSSFVMALEFVDGKPHANMFLSSSQSQQPDSPFFNDQTYLYSQLKWRPIAFSADEIKENTVNVITLDYTP